MKRTWAHTLSALTFGLLASTASAQAPSIIAPMAEDARIISTTVIDENGKATTIPGAGGPVSSTVASPYAADDGGHCDACGKGGGHGHGGGSWSGGGGVAFLKPIFSSNAAFRVIGIAAGATDNNTSFNWDYEASPQFWVGYTSATGLGVRGRFAFFDHNSSPQTITNDGTLAIFAASTVLAGGAFASAAAGDQVSAQSSLRFETYDVELTQQSRGETWSALFSAGGRYVHINQDYRFDVLTAAGVTSSMVAGHNFRGVGPTASAEARRALGTFGLGVYGNARGSLLWGSSRDTTIYSANTGRRSTDTDEDRFLPIGELELGLEYNRGFGRYQVVVQGGAVGQVWWGAGNATNSNSEGVIRDNNQDLGLFGFVLRAGLSF